MKKLFIRMVRDIKSNLGQFLSLVIVIAVGSFMFTGLFATIISIQKGVDHYYDNQNMADLWVRYQGISETQITDWNNQANLEDSDFEGRMVYNGAGIFKDQEVNLGVYSMTGINQLYLREGAFPENENEIVVDNKFAEANELELGASLCVISKGKNTDMKIVGIADSPENAWKISDASTTVTKHKTFAIAYTSLNTMKELTKKDFYSEVLVKTENPSMVINELEKVDGYISSTIREDNASVKAVQGGIDTIGVISYLFPIIFFLVAALISFISMCKMVENQRTQIAVMQAMGISKKVISIGFLIYAELAAIMGSFLFALAGNYMIPKLLVNMFTKRYIIPKLEIMYHPTIICLPFAMGSLFCGIATISAIWNVLKEVPAQAMRPKAPKKTKIIIIERITFIWRRIGYSKKLICRNIFLNKGRIILSSIGVIGSVTLMITGLSLRTSAETVVNQGKNQIAYDISILYNMPITKSNVLNSLDQVNLSEENTDLELSQILHAKVPDYEDQNMNVQILPYTSQSIHLVDSNKKELPITNEGIIMASSMADEYDLAVGDSIVLKYNEQEYNLPISNIVLQYTSNTAYISEGYAKDLGISFEPDMALISCQDENMIGDIVEYFNQEDTVKSVTTRMELTDSTGDSMAMLNTVIKLIIIAASILSITVIYNITAINIFERTRELATLMVLGHYKNESARLVFTENFVISGVGYIFGIPIGILLFQGILNTFEHAGIMLPQTITSKTLLLVLVIIMILSYVTNFVLKGRIKRIDMVEALKGVE